jgi:hypothetical protein
MIRKLMIIAVTALFISNIYGCVALVAGAAGGAGTASWLSGKLTQEFRASQAACVRASKNALKAVKVDIEKETVKDDVAQLIGKYTDGKTVWVDIHRISKTTQRIEVRVGGVSPDKEAEMKIMEKIENQL